MSLSRKILLISFSSIILLLLLIGGLIWVNTTSSFGRLEFEDVTSNLARAENIIKQNITQLDTLSIDYAHWTETYTYVDQPSQAYIDSALNESTFKSQNLNIIVIVRNSGEMLYGKDYDPASGQFGDIPAGFQDLLIPGAKLVAFTSEDSKVDGIANLPKGLLMVVSRPVLTDDSQGPSRGVIIMGRWITPEMTKGFAELVNLPGLLITSSSSSSLPHEYDQVKGDLPAGPKLVAIDDHTVAGYAMMEDIQQQKSIVIRLEEPRTIYQSGVDSFRNYAILLVLACLLFEGGVVFLLQILVVSPIKHLTQVAGKVLADIGVLFTLLGRSDRLSHGLLDVANNGGHFLGGQGRFFSQRAHLIRHHGKTFAMLAGPRRFNGRI